MNCGWHGGRLCCIALFVDMLVKGSYLAYPEVGGSEVVAPL